MANQESGATADGPLSMEQAAQLLSESRESEDQPEPTEEHPERTNHEESETEPKDTEEVTEGDSEVELPDTFEAFAEMLGVEPAELANHIRVKRSVDGKEELVTISDALKGNMMETDYRRKTSDLAEQNRRFQAELAQFQTERQQRLDRWDDLILGLETRVQGHSQEQLNKLLQEDPAQYLAVKAQQDDQQQALQQAKQERDEARKKTHDEQLGKIQGYRAEQQRLLLQAVPDFGKPEKSAKLEGDIVQGLKHYGFSDDEIGGFFNGPFDHRQVLLAIDAMKFRTLARSQVPKKLQGIKKIVRPGSSDKPKGTSVVVAQDRLDKLVKSGAPRNKQFEAAAQLMASRRK